MPQGRLLRQDDETGEETRASARKKCSQDVFNALTGDTGPLPAGALPNIKAASEQGKIAMFQALEDDGKGAARVAKPKKAKAPKAAGEAEQVEPKTITQSGPQETVLGIPILVFCWASWLQNGPTYSDMVFIGQVHLFHIKALCRSR